MFKLIFLIALVLGALYFSPSIGLAFNSVSILSISKNLPVKKTLSSDVLFKNIVRKKFTPMTLAELHVITALVDLGHNINARTSETGFNLLHIAVRKVDLYAIDFLLHQNININDQDFSGNTPLHYACNNGDLYKLHVIYLLAERDADFSIKNNEGHTCLDLAIRSYNRVKTSNHKNVTGALKVLELIRSHNRNRGQSKIN